MHDSHDSVKNNTLNPNVRFFMTSRSVPPLAIKGERMLRIWELESKLPNEFWEESRVGIITVVRNGLNIVSTHIVGIETRCPRLCGISILEEAVRLARCPEWTERKTKKLISHHEKSLHKQWKSVIANAMDISPAEIKSEIGGPLIVSKLANISVKEAVLYLVLG